MSISPLNPLSMSSLQTIIGTALNIVGLSPGQSSGVSPASQHFDNGQLSPFADLLSTLQQLQQSNPSQYQQVTQQIATNLQTAAQTAASQGDTAAANQLTQLSKDFSQASQNNQLPNVQDLARVLGGHHHHHHHLHEPQGSSDASSNSTKNQLLSLFQSSAAQSNALDPASIIEDTLASAGITGSN